MDGTTELSFLDAKGLLWVPSVAVQKARKTDDDYHDLAARHGYECSALRRQGQAENPWAAVTGTSGTFRYNDISSGYGCPACADKVVAPHNNLSGSTRKSRRSGSDKELAITADKVQRSSHKWFWWRCNSCGSDWQMMVNTRTAGRVAPTATAPCQRGRTHLRRDTLNLLRIASDSKRRFDAGNGHLVFGEKWFGGAANLAHVWHATVASRVSQGGHGCPSCSNQTSRAELRILAELRHIVPSVQARPKFTVTR